MKGACYQLILKNDISPLDYLGKGTFFLWTTFSGRGQNMVRIKKWPPFFGPKISVFGPKIRFLPYDPNFGQWPIFSPGMTVNFRLWEQFFDLPFRSYSCFRKKIRLTCQKVFPLPTVGALSASNSPSALSAQALHMFEPFIDMEQNKDSRFAGRR